MFLLVPCVSSWTGVFNQDYIQEAANVFPGAERFEACGGDSRCRPGACDERRERDVSSGVRFSLQTAFNNRKYITRRIRLTISTRPPIPRRLASLVNTLFVHLAINLPLSFSLALLSLSPSPG